MKKAGSNATVVTVGTTFAAQASRTTIGIAIRALLEVAPKTHLEEYYDHRLQISSTSPTCYQAKIRSTANKNKLKQRFNEEKYKILQQMNTLNV